VAEAGARRVSYSIFKELIQNWVRFSFWVVGPEICKTNPSFWVGENRPGWRLHDLVTRTLYTFGKDLKR
jgi:hypothetical protein